MLRVCEKHGEHEDWRIQKPYGHHVTPEPRCRPCDRERQRAAERKPWRIEARHRERARADAARKGAREVYRASVHVALLDQYGVVVADRYRAALEVAGPHGRVDLRRVLKSIISESRPELSDGQLSRVLQLNEISGQALAHIGWACNVCFIQSDDARFFDIDHIVPCSVIGKRTIRDRNNLQLLCPNCHRCKTLQLESWFELAATA